jgi:glycosyltransferase involved in cell wall biosynthesis
MFSNDLFNGYPSIILDKRPFFSIIIPCYKTPINYISKLLDSIIDQSLEKVIEVILVDDCSPYNDGEETYYEYVNDHYSDKLSIRFTKTNYNFGPGNTREKGLSIAEGEWVCFADHDDFFVPLSLHKVMQTIIDNNEQYYAIANFKEVDPDGNVIRTMEHTMNWNHAKFYNRENLIKAFDVHFKTDLVSHEDIYISSTINCIMNHLHRSPLFIDQYCYNWVSRPTSVSRTKYGDDKADHPFLEVFFDDYIASTAMVYFDKYEDHIIDKEYAERSILEVLGYTYFYMQGFLFHYPNNYIRDNIEYCRKLLIRVKKVFDITNKDIYDWFSNNDAEEYMKIYSSASIASGPYIPSYTLTEWLDYLHEDIHQKLTASDMMKKVN